MDKRVKRGTIISFPYEGEEGMIFKTKDKHIFKAIQCPACEELLWLDLKTLKLYWPDRDYDNYEYYDNPNPNPDEEILFYYGVKVIKG